MTNPSGDLIPKDAAKEILNKALDVVTIGIDQVDFAASRVEGAIASGQNVVVDELHAWVEQGRRLKDQLIDALP